MQRRFDNSLVTFALLVSAGMILGYIESLVFPHGIAYGIKLGISNIVVIFTIMFSDWRKTCLVAITKIVLSGLLFSTATTITYAACGVLLSIPLMYNLKRFFYPKTISVIGISIAGSAAFNIGQVLVACLMLGTSDIIYLLVYMLPLSVITGAVTGFVTYFLLNRIKRGI